MRVIVTGSSGFIGGHLAEALLKEGHEVVGIDNLKSGLQTTEKKLSSFSNFILCRDDIRSRYMYEIFCDFKPSWVFHLAAIPGVTNSINDPIETNDVNVNGTLNILYSARKSKVKKFIFSSSSSVYGGVANLPTKEDSPLRPKSPYALQKLIGEEYCKMFSNLYGLETTSLRYFNIFGPRQRADSEYAAVISSFCKAKKDGVPPKIYGDGKQFRDFTYVDNVVYANIMAAKSEINLNGQAFNIGCGEKTDLLTIAEKLGCMNPVFLDDRPGDVRCSQADISSAKNAIKYKPKIFLEEGLSRTLEWFYENNI